MTGDVKFVLHDHLRQGRAALLWKLEGLGDFDLRRPLVPTGTNLLGLVKHLTLVEAGYFGDTFGRPIVPWDMEPEDPHADMFARADESAADILAQYAHVAAEADRTIVELDLDSPGRVPWWREGHQDVTLARILVHVTAEVHRHAGHADIVRELIDGEAGWSAARDNLWSPDSWEEYRGRLQAIAEGFR